MNINEPITEGTRAFYRKKAGTIVAVSHHGYCYFNADSNKRGNDGMQLVAIGDIQPMIEGESK